MKTKFSYIKVYNDRFNIACQWTPNIKLLIIDKQLNLEIPIITGNSEIEDKIKYLSNNNSQSCFIKTLEWRFDYYEHKLKVIL